MLSDFIEEHMERHLHGFESAMQLAVTGEVVMSWEDDTDTGSFIEW